MQKTKNDLTAFLRETVPSVVYHYLINQGGGMRQCGTISDAFGAIAVDAGFEAYVTSRPGHFFNVVKVSDGVFEIDMSAIQFEFDSMADDDELELERLRKVIANDPFRAIKVRKIPDVPSWARPPSPEDEACFYTPVKRHMSSKNKIAALMRGEYGKGPGDQNTRDLLGGRPYGAEMKPLEIECVMERVMLRLISRASLV